MQQTAAFNSSGYNYNHKPVDVLFKQCAASFVSERINHRVRVLSTLYGFFVLNNRFNRANASLCKRTGSVITFFVYVHCSCTLF